MLMDLCLVCYLRLASLNEGALPGIDQAASSKKINHFGVFCRRTSPNGTVAREGKAEPHLYQPGEVSIRAVEVHQLLLLS